MRPTPTLERRGELLGRLVVAVQDEALGGHPGGQRDMQLAARRHVEVHALLVGERGPWPGTGRPWWRRRRRRPRRSTASRQAWRRCSSS